MTEELQQYIPLPVHVENDANAAAYGEYIATGGKSKSFVMMTLGTGVGGGISREGDNLLNPLKKLVYENDYNKYMPKTEIAIAQLFNDADIVGAAMAAKHSRP